MHAFLISVLLAIAPAFAQCELEGAQLSVDQRTWTLGTQSYKLSRRDERTAFEQALAPCVGPETWESYYHWRTFQLRGQTTALTGAGVAPLIMVALPLATVGVAQIAGPGARHQDSFIQQLESDLAVSPAAPVSPVRVLEDQETLRRHQKRAVVIPVATATTTATLITIFALSWSNFEIVSMS